MSNQQTYALPVGIDRPQVDALTGVRLIAAVWVVIEHFQKPLFVLAPISRHGTSVIQGGYLGVEIFFVLSGFIISYQYADRLARFTRQGYLRYLQLRFARIYPVHLVSLLIVIGLVFVSKLAHAHLNYTGKYTYSTLLPNFIMLQSVPPGSAWNSPAWSLTMEGLAYVIFPVLALILVSMSSRIKILTCIFIALGWTVGLTLLIGHAGNWSSTSLPEQLARITGEFTAGCFIWALWRQHTRSRWWDGVGVGALVAAISILVILPSYNPSNLWALPPLALFVFACASSNGFVAALLSTRAFIWGGRISYSLYMTHFIVLMVAGKLLPWTKFAAEGPMIRVTVLICYAVVLITSAAVMYHLIEVPARRWLAPKNRHKAAATHAVPGRTPPSKWAS